MNTINTFILENILLPVSMVTWAAIMLGLAWSTFAEWGRQWKQRKAEKAEAERES